MAVHAKKANYRDAFAGLMFPASKVSIVTRSRMIGGLDREVLAVVASIANRSYQSLDELEEAVRQVYLARGTIEEELPI